MFGGKFREWIYTISPVGTEEVIQRLEIVGSLTPGTYTFKVVPKVIKATSGLKDTLKTQFDVKKATGAKSAKPYTRGQRKRN